MNDAQHVRNPRIPVVIPKKSDKTTFGSGLLSFPVTRFDDKGKFIPDSYKVHGYPNVFSLHPYKFLL